MHTCASTTRVALITILTGALNRQFCSWLYRFVLLRRECFVVSHWILLAICVPFLLTLSLNWSHLKIISVAIPSGLPKIANGIFPLDLIHRSIRARTVYMPAGEKKQMWLVNRRYCLGKVKFAVHNGSVWICVLLLSIAAIMIAVIGLRDNLSCIKAKWFTPHTHTHVDLTHCAVYIAASHSYILHYILPLSSDTSKWAISTAVGEGETGLHVVHIVRLHTQLVIIMTNGPLYYGVPDNAKQTLFI